MPEDTKIDDKALDSLSVAPPAPKDGSKSDAGQDEAINRRLARDPESKEAQLDTALDKSMDASDPPSSTQPVHSHEPQQSSGYDAEAEEKRQRDRK